MHVPHLNTKASECNTMGAKVCSTSDYSGSLIKTVVKHFLSDITSDLPDNACVIIGVSLFNPLIQTNVILSTSSPAQSPLETIYYSPDERD